MEKKGYMNVTSIKVADGLRNQVLTIDDFDKNELCGNYIHRQKIKDILVTIYGCEDEEGVMIVGYSNQYDDELFEDDRVKYNWRKTLGENIDKAIDVAYETIDREIEIASENAELSHWRRGY